MKTCIARLRGRLTYGNITATLALFIALGGTSYAAITLPRNSVGTEQLRTGAVHGKDIRNGTIQTADMSKRARNALRGQQGPAGPAGVTEHAQISSSGDQVYGTATRSSWGATTPEVHRLEFGRDVSQCAYSATLADVPGGNVPTAVAGRITVASAGGPAIVVKTYDVAGNPAELPFHVIVAC